MEGRDRFSPHIQAILAGLPMLPGVYQFFNAAGEIIYVGKAKILKNRVLSYFREQADRPRKVAAMIAKIADLKYFIVDSETDALLLENNLIKKYQPRYNILLKDDKSYPWICIRKEPFPRVFAMRNPVQDGSQYFGPYSSVTVMRTVLELIKQLYPLRTCNLQLSEDAVQQGRYKVCLEYHIGNCKGPCTGRQDRADYDRSVDEVRDILQGNIHRVIRMLRQQMNDLAAQYRFEEAEQIRRRIAALERYQARSTVVNPSIHNVDVFSLYDDIDAAYVNFLKVSNGAIIQAYTAEMVRKLDETKEELLGYAITEIREKFHSTSTEVIVPFLPADSLPGVTFTVPRIGDKKKLLELSGRNVVFYHTEKKKQLERIDPERHTRQLLETMQRDLHLAELPVHIECFDNSNIQGTDAVSSCVVFRDAKPCKRDYRHFNVKTVQDANDFATMQEVIARRYTRLVEEGKPLPQLVVIDGGKGQLSAVMETLDRLGLRGRMAVIGIAKRLEEIYFPGDSYPLSLDKRSETLKIIQQLRDEAHRFGITHHRDKRSKHMLVSEIEQIPGIGSQSRDKLLQHFHTLSRIKAASEDELSAVVGRSRAAAIRRYLSGKDDASASPGVVS